MSKAVVETRTITETTVTLTLTKAEAEALAVVVGNVAGATEGTPRKHTDGIYHALKSAGVKTTGPGEHPSNKISGVLRFHASSTEAERAQRRTSPGVPDFLRGLGY